MSKLEEEDPTFHVTYHVESWPEGLKKSEMHEDFGACDSLVQVVMVHDKTKEQKHFSVMSMNGETSEPLPLHEQWEAWYVLGRSLSQMMRGDDPEHGWKQQVAEGVIEVCQAMRKDGRRKQEVGIVDAHGRPIKR